MASTEKGTNLLTLVKVDLKTSAALDASVKDTPGLYVQDDTDLVAKVVNSIEACKFANDSSDNPSGPSDFLGILSKKTCVFLFHLFPTTNCSQTP